MTTPALRVAILGASSQSTPALFQSLAGHAASSRMSFRLVARSKERLQPVHRACAAMLRDGAAISCFDFDKSSLHLALQDADVVVIQIRYGGLEGRDFDEQFPLAFGICGDEGLGPGGLSAAWRSWLSLKDLLGSVQRCSPHAMILLLTSPVSLLTRLALSAYPELRLFGICELPWTSLSAETFGSPHSAVYDYVGINHLGWIYGLESREAPVPLKYLRLHFDSRRVLQEQQHQDVSRAAQLQGLSDAAMQVYANGDKSQIAIALASRPAPWYSEAVVPFVLALVEGSSRTHFFLSTRNDDWNSEFQPDDILEIPFLYGDNKLTRKPVLYPPSREILDVLKPFVEYERLAATAVNSQDAALLQDALQRHPWVTTDEKAAQLSEVIVRQSVSTGVSV